MSANFHYNIVALSGVNVGLGFTLNNWSAFIPNQAKGNDQHLLNADDALDVSFLPPMKRRRLSRLSRLSLRLAHAVAPDFQGYCVFGSQHGELVTTQGLLESIVKGEIVSPAGFSASVHNTAVGLHSINCKNTHPCTSVAAGVDTLAMCFVETLALLHSGEAQEVLLVCADDVVPDGLSEYITENELKGFAALVRRGDKDSDNAITLTHEQQDNAELDDSTENFESIRSLVTLLMETGQNPVVVVPGEIGQWRWQYDVK